ncbi:MAG: hypothetical protein QM493_10035 [Sulfurovum sp.]
MFNHQSSNVQELRKAINFLIKDIHEAKRKHRLYDVEIKTKLLAMTYSAWSEAQFIQIIYTPDALTSEQLNSLLNDSGIFNRWKELLNYLFDKVEKFNKNKSKEKIEELKQNFHNNELDNKIKECNFYYKDKSIKQKNTIIKYLENYIEKQSMIRNKIAHGQWKIALDKGNKYKINALTKQLESLNVFSIRKEFKVHTILGKIIRDLIQSPYKSFDKNYEKDINKIKSFLENDTKRDLKFKLKKIKFINTQKVLTLRDFEYHRVEFCKKSNSQ